MKNHYSIDPINVYVSNDLLFDDEKEVGKTKGKIIALNLYLNETLTFDVLLDNGSLFCYVPIHKIFTKNDSNSDYDLKDLVYHNTKDFNISINEIEYLKNKNSYCFFKYKNKWEEISKYLFTIDWFEGNDLLHFVELKNGQFALIPSHKIKFDSKQLEFEDYKKIRKEWIV